MTDKDKIISRLRIIRTWASVGPSIEGRCLEDIVRWLDDAIALLDDAIALLDDAIALLKAQEPVKPKYMEFVDEGMTWEKYEVPTCGVCGALLGDALFCPMCGKKVKWE